MPNPIRLDVDAISKDYNVEDFVRLALEQNWYIGEMDNHKPIIINYTLKDLTAMPFEQWAYLIEIENKNNNE